MPLSYVCEIAYDTTTSRLVSLVQLITKIGNIFRLQFLYSTNEI